MTPPLILIAAVGSNRAIGRGNALLWHLPQDMAHFKALTAGQTVLMGRRTWESLPPRYRPLPGRRNIVISRTPDYRVTGAEVAASLPAALALARLSPHGDRVFVIGGGEIYAQSLPLAEQLILTEVDDAPAADTFFPMLNAGEWREVSRHSHPRTDATPAFAFVTYERIS